MYVKGAIFLVKNRKTVGKVIAGIVVGLIAFLFIFSNPGFQDSDSGELTNVGLPESVTRWEPTVRKYARENDIEAYVPIILAIIMVESRGEGIDIMQCRESGAVVTDPESSIKGGVAYVARAIHYAESKECDVWTAIQGYNYGIEGYVNYVSSNGKRHSVDIAEKYSRNVVAPSLGNSAGITYSYVNEVSMADGRTYLYLNGGNFFYCSLVKQYVEESTSGSGVVSSAGFAIPVKNPQISSGFVVRTNPVTGQTESHKGLDFAQPMGDSIMASKAGEVVIAQYDGMPVSGYGKCIILDHKDGTWTLYAHQSELLVKVGEKVKQGQVIGKVGSTGQSTGPHLHFEIRHSLYGDQVDPKPILGL